MRLSSNVDSTLWYVLDSEDKIMFVSMFKEVAEDFIKNKGVRKSERY